jgi:hypothetical protein
LGPAIRFRVVVAVDAGSRSPLREAFRARLGAMKKARD